MGKKDLCKYFSIVKSNVKAKLFPCNTDSNQQYIQLIFLTPISNWKMHTNLSRTTNRVEVQFGAAQLKQSVAERFQLLDDHRRRQALCQRLLSSGQIESWRKK